MADVTAPAGRDPAPRTGLGERGRGVPSTCPDTPASALPSLPHLCAFSRSPRCCLQWPPSPPPPFAPIYLPLTSLLFSCVPWTFSQVPGPPPALGAAERAVGVGRPLATPCARPRAWGGEPALAPQGPSPPGPEGPLRGWRGLRAPQRVPRTGFWKAEGGVLRKGPGDAEDANRLGKGRLLLQARYREGMSLELPHTFFWRACPGSPGSLVWNEAEGKGARESRSRGRNGALSQE